MCAEHTLWAVPHTAAAKEEEATEVAAKKKLKREDELGKGRSGSVGYISIAAIVAVVEVLTKGKVVAVVVVVVVVMVVVAHANTQSLPFQILQLSHSHSCSACRQTRRLFSFSLVRFVRLRLSRNYLSSGAAMEGDHNNTDDNRSNLGNHQDQDQQHQPSPASTTNEVMPLSNLGTMNHLSPSLPVPQPQRSPQNDQVFSTSSNVQQPSPPLPLPQPSPPQQQLQTYQHLLGNSQKANQLALSILESNLNENAQIYRAFYEKEQKMTSCLKRQKDELEKRNAVLQQQNDNQERIIAELSQKYLNDQQTITQLNKKVEELEIQLLFQNVLSNDNLENCVTPSPLLENQQQQQNQQLQHHLQNQQLQNQQLVLNQTSTTSTSTALPSDDHSSHGYYLRARSSSISSAATTSNTTMASSSVVLPVSGNRRDAAVSNDTSSMNINSSAVETGNMISAEPSGFQKQVTRGRGRPKKNQGTTASETALAKTTKSKKVAKVPRLSAMDDDENVSNLLSPAHPQANINNNLLRPFSSSLETLGNLIVSSTFFPTPPQESIVNGDGHGGHASSSSPSTGATGNLAHLPPTLTPAFTSTSPYPQQENSGIDRLLPELGSLPPSPINEIVNTLMGEGYDANNFPDAFEI